MSSKEVLKKLLNINKLDILILIILLIFQYFSTSYLSYGCVYYRNQTESIDYLLNETEQPYSKECTWGYNNYNKLLLKYSDSIPRIFYNSSNDSLSFSSSELSNKVSSKSSKSSICKSSKFAKGFNFIDCNSSHN